MEKLGDLYGKFDGTAATLKKLALRGIRPPPEPFACPEWGPLLGSKVLPPFLKS
jgi:hypothetical protein